MNNRQTLLVIFILVMVISGATGSILRQNLIIDAEIQKDQIYRDLYRPAIFAENDQLEKTAAPVQSPVQDQKTETEVKFSDPGDDGINALRKVNDDVIGWLHIDQTAIDFAFAQSKDNDYYLYKDINREYSISGTVFLDYRCKPDFSSPVSILYGHHMKKAAKFTWLDAFAEASYLKEHKNLEVLLADQYIRAEIISSSVVSADHLIWSLSDASKVYQILKSEAEIFVDEKPYNGEEIILLCTCNYDIDHGRTVVAARVENRSFLTD